MYGPSGESYNLNQRARDGIYYMKISCITLP